MFGKVRHHYRNAIAMGKGVAHRLHGAYHQGLKIAGHVDRAVKYGKELYAAASPLLSDLIGQRGQAIADRGAAQAFGAYDKGRGQVMEASEKVLDKIRGGGVLLDKLRQVQAPTGMYNY